MCGLYGWVFYCLKICRNGVFFTEKSVEMGIFFNLYTSIYIQLIRNRYKIARNRQNINNHQMIVKDCDRHANDHQTIVRNPDNVYQKSVDMGLRPVKNL